MLPPVGSMGQTRQFCRQSSEGIPVGSIPAGSGLRRTRSQRDLTRLNNRTSLGEGWTNVMRAMRAEGFSGYKDLKRVDIPKPAVSDGRVL